MRRCLRCSIRSLTLLAVVLALAACEVEEEDPAVDASADGSHDSIDGSDDAIEVTDTEPDTTWDIPLGPRECFEVFGPRGISHDAPREHDAGVVVVGEALTRSVRFYNFSCEQARITAEVAVAAPEGLTVEVDAPTAGTGAGQGGQFVVEVTLTPSEAGIHVASVTLPTDGGVYELQFAVEAVEEGEGPAQLAVDCLELEAASLDFGEVEVDAMANRALKIEAGAACALVFGESHLVVGARLEDAPGFAFETEDGEALEGPVSYVLFEGGASDSDARRDFVRLVFSAQAAGEHTGTLVLETNAPQGEHRIALTASSP